MPVPISRRPDIGKPQSPRPQKTNLMDYIFREVFRGSHQNQCMMMKEERPEHEIIEKVREIFKHLGEQDFQLTDKLSHDLKEVENFLQNNNKIRFGRKLLSIDHCSEKDCNSDERIDTDDNKEEEEEEDADNDEEEQEEVLDVDENDLPDEETLEALLSGLDFGRKIHHINELLDKFVTIISSASEDKDRYVSAIQSLLVYVSAIDDLKEERTSEENSKNLEALRERMKSLQRKYLSQITHFDTFFTRAWESFEELLEKEAFDRKNKNDVKVLNDFIFNFHYASEIETIIKRRDIEDELIIIEDLEEDMKVMKNAYESLGYGEEEVQNDEYFSRILDNIEDEDIYQSRRLLSISDQTCNADDVDCNHDEGKDAPSSDDYKRCQDVLLRAEKIRDQLDFKEDQFKTLKDYDDRLNYIRSFMKELKYSKTVLKDYQELISESKYCQEYLPFKKKMKRIIESIQSKAGNLDWIQQVSSFLFETKSSDDLIELSEILKEYDDIDKNSDDKIMSTDVRKRSLLSIDTCEKDDLNCKQRESDLVRGLKNSKNNVKGENKDKTLRRLKHELDEAYQNAGKNKASGKKFALGQCQQFLEKSKKELNALSNMESKAETIKTLKPKEKIIIIKEFMSFMTKVRSLFDDYKDISSSLITNDDKNLCHPVLKEAFNNLITLQKLSGKAEWFSEMNSLLSTEDPEVIKEISDIMLKFKMN